MNRALAFMPDGFFLPPYILFFIIAAMLIGLVTFIVFRLMERKRSNELKDFASENGWGFIDRDAKERPKKYKTFGPFGKGHSRYAYNIMTGESDGVTFEVFDYHYAETRRGHKSSNTTHYYHKVCALQMPIKAPGLSIQREHIGHKLMKTVGAGDISFESDEFTRKYWVKSDDRRFAYDVIHTGMMEFLLENQGWHWEWKGDRLLVHKKGKLRPAKAKKMVRLATRFRTLLPRHVLADATARTRAEPTTPSRT